MISSAKDRFSGALALGFTLVHTRAPTKSLHFTHTDSWNGIGNHFWARVIVGPIVKCNVTRSNTNTRVQWLSSHPLTCLGLYVCGKWRTDSGLDRVCSCSNVQCCLTGCSMMPRMAFANVHNRKNFQVSHKAFHNTETSVPFTCNILYVHGPCTPCASYAWRREPHAGC